MHTNSYRREADTYVLGVHMKPKDYTYIWWVRMWCVNSYQAETKGLHLHTKCAYETERLAYWAKVLNTTTLDKVQALGLIQVPHSGLQSECYKEAMQEGNNCIHLYEHKHWITPA